MSTTKKAVFGCRSSNRSGMLTKINQHFFPDNEDIKQAYIYLKGEITIESCADAIESILSINYPTFEEDDEGFQVQVDDFPDVINLMITSDGGDMSAAFALINVMRGSRIPVRTIALGEAASAGLCILMAGNQRVVTPYTMLMSHAFSSGANGSYHDIMNAAGAFKAYHEKMLAFYMECTGLDKKFIQKNLLAERDHYITAEQAIQYDMIDLIETLE